MADLAIRKDRRAGRITLTRPQALNALTHAMVLDITAALTGWRDDPGTDLVIIDAEGGRAFCSGGDVAAIWHAARAGDHAEGRRFFADEYRMNALIENHPRPIVAFMQGWVMGGGVGVGGHARVGVVGDSTRMAMPEVGIGLIPDVGGSWLLSRAPGRIGEYLGLTGARVGAGDAIRAGLADRYLPEGEWPAAIDRLAATGRLDAIPQHPAPPSPLAGRDLSAFGQVTVAEILRALEATGDAGALAAMRRASPLSLAAALAVIRAARGDRRIEEALSREYRFTSRATEHADFLEGIRAQLIERDRAPRWSAPADRAAVEAMLAPLGAGELRWEDAEG